MFSREVHPTVRALENRPYGEPLPGPVKSIRSANPWLQAPGKYADMVVLDRNYLTVPADSIKDLKPMMTLVGGKVVHEAKK